MCHIISAQFVHAIHFRKREAEHAGNGTHQSNHAKAWEKASSLCEKYSETRLGWRWRLHYQWQTADHPAFCIPTDMISFLYSWYDNRDDKCIPSNVNLSSTQNTWNLTEMLALALASMSAIASPMCRLGEVSNTGALTGIVCILFGSLWRAVLRDTSLYCAINLTCPHFHEIQMQCSLSTCILLYLSLPSFLWKKNLKEEHA